MQYSIAQPKPIPPPRDTDSTIVKKNHGATLPMIDLPEFVIMGNERVYLLASQKSLLSLYNSDEFTQRSGLGMREFKQSLYNAAPLEPIMQPMSGSKYNGKVRAGVGTYLSPFFEAMYARSISTGDYAVRAMYVYLRDVGRYHGYSRGEFSLSGGSFIHRNAHPLFARSRVEGTLDIQYDRFPSLPQGGERIDPQWPTFLDDRKFFSVGYGVTMRSRDNRYIDYSASIRGGHTVLNDDTHGAILSFDQRTTENVYSFDGTVSKKWREFLWSASTSINLYSLQYAVPRRDVRTPLFLNIGGAAAWSARSDLRLTANLTAYVYRHSFGDATVRLYPLLSAEYSLNPSFHLFGEAGGAVKRQSIGRLHKINRSAYSEFLLHEDYPLLATLGCRYNASTQLLMESSFEYSQSRFSPHFYSTRAADPLDAIAPPSFWYVTQYPYGISRLFTWNLRGAYAFTPYDRFEASWNVRASRNSETGAELYHTAPLDARLSYEHAFDFPLMVKVYATFIGRRVSSASPNVRHVESIIDLSIDAEYSLMDRYSAFIRFSNLLDRRDEQWDGYPVRPFFVMIGVTAQF